MLKKSNKCFLISLILNGLVFVMSFLVLVLVLNADVNITEVTHSFGVSMTNDFFIIVFILSLLSMISNLISIVYNEKISVFLTIFFDILLLILSFGDISLVVYFILTIILLMIGCKKQIKEA